MSALDDRRRRELAAIHAKRKQLALDEDGYRAFLAALTNKRSAADLTVEERRKVLDRMTTILGCQRDAYPRRPNNFGTKPELAKVEALLAEARLPWSYADALARRMYGVHAVAWCQSEQLRGVITALVKHAQRHDRRTE